jgi:hypothetical protein
MNAEKTEHLRSLETEQPPLTVLHTYINRKQRDPGALKDALDSGGYFFPTNPQSSDELQNLLANSLGDVARERRCTTAQLLADEKVSYTLRSLGCSIEGSRIVVRGGVEGGLFGLMAGYLVMLDETIPRNDTAAISTWNQASIGAALAAAVLADLELPSTASSAVSSSAKICPHASTASLTSPISSHSRNSSVSSSSGISRVVAPPTSAWAPVPMPTATAATPSSRQACFATAPSWARRPSIPPHTR